MDIEKIIEEFILAYKTEDFKAGYHYIMPSGQMLFVESALNECNIPSVLLGKNCFHGITTRALKDLGWILINTNTRIIECGNMLPTGKQRDKLEEAISFMRDTITVKALEQSKSFFRKSTGEIIARIMAAYTHGSMGIKGE